jgi:hypothetical protein
VVAAQSPDFNPIENHRSHLNFICRDWKPSTKEQLLEIIEDTWNEIDEEYLSNLVYSMRNKIAQAVERKDTMLTNKRECT